MTKYFYITTPIYYVNDVPHIGHAYTTLAADVLARFKRLDGYDVKFLTGTDEHGQKVAKSAALVGMTPQAFTDKVSQSFRDLCMTMNYSNDDFIRTTEPRHYRAAQALWDKLIARGEIYLDKYAGWYAVRDEAFYGEDELREEGGKKIAPSGAECEWVEEESYFFRLSAWQERLLKYYEDHLDFIAPASRRNEVISFVKGGLKDLSVSRTTFSWGVPVPGSDKHIMYVWLDALTNYITVLGYPDVTTEMKNFWPTTVHLVGKDILRFHAVYWPAFLMAAELTPPRRIFANGWWMAEGQKMSKSLGNVIAPQQLVDSYGLDQTRYFLLRDVPFGNDGDFSHAQMIARVNAELANNIGNLVQRTLSFIQKNAGAAVPRPGEYQPQDERLLNQIEQSLADIRENMDRQEFHKALESILALAAAANVYIDAEAPWTLKKTDSARMTTVLYVLCEIIRALGFLLLPFMPDSAGKILDAVAVALNKRTYEYYGKVTALVPGTPLPAPQPIFPRFESIK